MPERLVTNESEREAAANFILATKPPFKMSVTLGTIRSLAQNALSHKWYSEIAAQREDMTVAEVRAECKLIFGVPILREENPEFRRVYDKILKPLPYETKLDFIEKTELPVTRIMNIGQLSHYLDAMYQHFAKAGIYLELPEEMQCRK